MTKRENIMVVSGDFDPISYNQFNILKTCRSHCDWLIVGVHSDPYMEVFRGFKTYTYEQRKEMIEALPFVDEVFAFNDADGTSCSLLKLIKICYPNSIITFVSHAENYKDLPESKVRGIKFQTVKTELN